MTYYNEKRFSGISLISSRKREERGCCFISVWKQKKYGRKSWGKNQGARKTLKNIFPCPLDDITLKNN